MPNEPTFLLLCCASGLALGFLLRPAFRQRIGRRHLPPRWLMVSLCVVGFLFFSLMALMSYMGNYPYFGVAFAALAGTQVVGLLAALTRRQHPGGESDS